MRQYIVAAGLLILSPCYALGQVVDCGDVFQDGLFGNRYYSEEVTQSKKFLYSYCSESRYEKRKKKSSNIDLGLDVPDEFKFDYEGGDASDQNYSNMEKVCEDFEKTGHIDSRIESKIHEASKILTDAWNQCIASISNSGRRFAWAWVDPDTIFLRDFTLSVRHSYPDGRKFKVKLSGLVNLDCEMKEFRISWERKDVSCKIIDEGIEARMIVTADGASVNGIEGNATFRFPPAMQPEKNPQYIGCETYVFWHSDPDLRLARYFNFDREEIVNYRQLRGLHAVESKITVNSGEPLSDSFNVDAKRKIGRVHARSMRIDVSSKKNSNAAEWRVCVGVPLDRM